MALTVQPASQPASQPLVLSLFPGVGLLDKAFELEGFCVVRGPDLLWGGDVHRFHPPSGRFDGVIGGPPCKGESQLAHLNGTAGVSLEHEFRRVRCAARPRWWVMEAVKPRRADHLERSCECESTPCSCWCHAMEPICLTPRWLGETQSRKRWFHSNLNLRPHIQTEALEPSEWRYAVLAGHGGKIGSTVNRMATYSWAEMCALQGLGPDYDLPSFTRQAKREAVGNGVPLVMGRAIAKAVRLATMALDA